MGKAKDMGGVMPLPAGPPRKGKKIDKAFDVWLNRSLQNIYGDIAGEPIPEELLKLIKEDRDK